MCVLKPALYPDLFVAPLKVKQNTEFNTMHKNLHVLRKLFIYNFLKLI